MELNPSVVTIGDTVWQVLPATVEYAKDNLRVNGFKICHDKQSIAIDGRATKDLNDSLNVELKDINISYILNLVNFHSVEFSGMATGTATVAAPFAQQPKAYARLRVDDFRFEDGRMGTLHANVDRVEVQRCSKRVAAKVYRSSLSEEEVALKEILLPYFEKNKRLLKRKALRQ